MKVEAFTSTVNPVFFLAKRDWWSKLQGNAKPLRWSYVDGGFQIGFIVCWYCILGFKPCVQTFFRCVYIYIYTYYIAYGMIYVCTCIHVCICIYIYIYISNHIYNVSFIYIYTQCNIHNALYIMYFKYNYNTYIYIYILYILGLYSDQCSFPHLLGLKFHGW